MWELFVERRENHCIARKRRRKKKSFLIFRKNDKEISVRLSQWLSDLQQGKSKKSLAHFNRAKAVMPRGVPTAKLVAYVQVIN